MPRLIALLHRQDFRGFAGLHSCGSSPTSAEGIINDNLVGEEFLKLQDIIACSLIQLLQEEEGVKEGHRGPQLLTALNEWAGEAVFQELTVQLRGREEITEQ